MSTELDALKPGLHVLGTMHGLGTAEALYGWAMERANTGGRVVWFDAEFRRDIGRDEDHVNFVPFCTNKVEDVGRRVTGLLAYGVQLVVIDSISSLITGRVDSSIGARTAMLAKLDEELKISGAVGVGIVYLRSAEGRVYLKTFQEFVDG